ncbi:Xylose isomerase-like TIM barrel [Variovorax sp. PBL-H6]|uniref:sugar phosphate isomerase/epimerase family protein n=1 Tax=Variovorax sp. PBL-H6 TaxID=434009 RepID=UPI0013187985|nr:TIM barrel protein [Variovorax sp. PBL-H6]VTU31872.1 Xylose isomerase-like TIM barrel [Variovorax sp. PBL-H6]
MKHRYSLAQLIALPFSPPEMVQLAADTGCAAAGIRLLPTTPGGLHYPLMDNPAMLRETLARMEATGVEILDLEVLRINADFDVHAYRRFLEVGAKLKARHILVAGDDPDPLRLTASFAALCDAAQPYGLTADLEFMPWTQVPDVQAAARIVGGAARPNGGVLVDALHFARCGSSLDDVSALSPQWLHYGQICDGPMPGPDSVEGLIHAARCERMLPGEGAIGLAGLFARLPAGLPISIEVPSETRAPAMGYAAWARKAIEGAQATLE